MRLPLLLRLASLFLLLAVARAAAPDPFPGTGRKWIQVRSPHFEIYSASAEWAARDQLYHLEVLRALFLGTFKLVERRPLEITVFDFESDRDFKAYKPAAYRENEFFAGFYLPGPDRAVITMANRGEIADNRQLIFHEYVHHLFRVTEEQPPTWFNEGMADLFSSIEIEGKNVIIGKARASRIRTLQNEKLLPLESVFATDHTSAIYTAAAGETGVFYAESWALIHYLRFGLSDLPPAKIDEFLRIAGSRQAATNPAIVRDACQRCLGLDYGELSKRLDRYVSSGEYRARKTTLPTVDDEKTYTSRVVPADEIRLRLAELTLRVNKSADGKLLLLSAAEKNPNDPRLLEVLGTAAMFEGDQGRARDRWQQAIDAGSTNPAIYHELAQMEDRQLFRSFDFYYEMPDDTAARLRKLLHRSIEIAPGQSAAYETLAWVEATAREPVPANVLLVQEHFNQVKNGPRTMLALTMVRVHLKQNDAALGMLTQLDQMEPDLSTARAAEVVRAKLEGRPVRRLPGNTPVRRSGPDVKVAPTKIAPPPIQVPAKP